MKLLYVLDHIIQFKDDFAIFVPIDSRPDELSDAVVQKIILTDVPPGIEMPDGMKYFLEVDLVKEVIRVWKAWRLEKDPLPHEKYEAVVYYVNNDAYLPVD